MDKSDEKEVQRLISKENLLIKAKEWLETSFSFSKDEMAVLDKALNELNGYLNPSKNENEYVYVYIADKFDILNARMNERTEQTNPDYIKNIVFEDGCGFTKYKIRKDAYQYSIEAPCNHIFISKLYISLDNVSEAARNDILKKFIEPTNKMIVIFEYGTDFFYINTDSMRSREKLDYVSGEICFFVRSQKLFFYPYLKPTPLKVVREIQ